MNPPKTNKNSYNSLCNYLDHLECQKHFSYGMATNFNNKSTWYFSKNYPDTYYNENIDEYLKWQNEHEANITTTEDEMKIKVHRKKENVHIDVSLNNIGDIIKLIEEHTYNPTKEYNIDLKSLHVIKEELNELNNMIGMKSIKSSILYQLLYFIQGFAADTKYGDYKHTVITGPPGTGKTEVAKILGKMYSKLGILKKNIFKKVTRADLVAGYLGQTALKTKKVIDECLNGVLFIDEAYSLQPDDMFSRECLDTLCEALSDHKQNLMVVIAGYENEINETFFKANSGLKSRFIWSFNIDNYTSGELYDIFLVTAKNRNWKVDSSVKSTWFEKNKDNFEYNGRSMEQLFTYSKICHSKRIYGNTNEISKLLKHEDLEKGLKRLKENSKKEKMFIGLYI